MWIWLALLLQLTKKRNQWENLMLRMYAPDIYPNTEGNIGVLKKNVKIQVVCG